LGVGAEGWEAPGERKPRGGFKISHLEDMFASNAYISNVYPIARDQAGCRMLQHKLDEGGPEVQAAIFNEVLTHMVELMMDPFGNYLCQKVIDMCSPNQLQLVLDKTCGALVRISLNMHGARAVQKLIDAVRSTMHIPRLVAALEQSVVALTKDANGNHVVQRCLEALPPEAHAFIVRAVANEVIDVASHRHGCRIVQRCIDAARGPERQHLIDCICQSSLTLVQDPFGNYVVQYILGLQDPRVNAGVINNMFGRLNVLSRQKFSSNVVEKCLQLCNVEDKNRMIVELADSRGLGELLRDVYGNYVVQSALSIAPEPQLSYFLSAVRPLLPSLRASGQGRRIAQKLEKKYPQLRPAAEASAASGAGGRGGGGGPAQQQRRGGGGGSPDVQAIPDMPAALGGGMMPMAAHPGAVQMSGLIMPPGHHPAPCGGVGVPGLGQALQGEAAGGGRGAGSNRQKRGRRKDGGAGGGASG
jgi:hypothetical protein